jgi:hypothetical protein
MLSVHGGQETPASGFPGLNRKNQAEFLAHNAPNRLGGRRIDLVAKALFRTQTLPELVYMRRSQDGINV